MWVSFGFNRGIEITVGGWPVFQYPMWVSFGFNLHVIDARLDDGLVSVPYVGELRIQLCTTI